MWAIRPTFILVACAAPASARRITQHEQAQTEVLSAAAEGAASKSNASARIWETKDHRFCISEDSDLTCGEFSTIVVQTATYNKAKKDGKSGKTCTPYAWTTDEQDVEDPCKPKYTEFIKGKCDGHHHCKIRVQDHKSCVSHPFTFMRVLYGCDSIKAKPEDTSEEEEEEEVVETRDRSTTVVGDGPIADDDFGQKPAPKVPKKQPKGYRGVRTEKALEEQKQRDEAITLTKCYRKNRLDKIKEGALFGRLTDCGSHESCYKVAFQNPDGTEKWYEDENGEPDDDVFLQGQLVTAKDRWLVSWTRGIGLKRSDYYSWGICLPNNGDKPLAYATGIWESLKLQEELKQQANNM